MQSALEASRGTLESIDLSLIVYGEENLPRFWHMHFPRLRSLRLGLLLYNIRDPREMYTVFIVAHANTLEELTLSYSAHNDQTGLYNPELLKEKSLPRLKKFHGDIKAFSQMADAQMDCLHTTLEHLTIGRRVSLEQSSDDTQLDTISAYFQRTLRSVPLTALRELKIEGPALKAHHFTELIATVQKSCPSLEVWLGDIHAEINVQNLAEVFSLFERLRVIHLRPKVIGAGEVEDYVLGLANSCLKLEKVVVDRYRSKKDMSFYIDRDELIPRIYYTEEL